MPTELAEKPLTPKEKELITSMSKPGATVEVIAPKDMDAKEWTAYASATCKALHRVHSQEQQLMMSLGALLIVAKESEAIWKTGEYTAFDDFLKAEVIDKFGVGRSTCYEAVQHAKFAEKAHITVQEYKEIGRVNMKRLIQAVPDGDENKADVRRLIEKAKELDTSSFVDHLVKKNYLDSRDDTVGAYFRIPGSKANVKRLYEFVEDPDVQAYCGSGKPDKILDKAREECAITWKARAQEVAAASKE